jgi:sodium/potassium-transporting ATPase subunit beta
VGRHEADQEHLGNITYFPEQGFPGYYYPFRNQIGFRSPVVAVHISGPTRKSYISFNKEASVPIFHMCIYRFMSLCYEVCCITYVSHPLADFLYTIFTCKR